jgi:hypothetical protein
VKYFGKTARLDKKEKETKINAGRQKKIKRKK